MTVKIHRVNQLWIFEVNGLHSFLFANLANVLINPAERDPLTVYKKSLT